MRACMRCFTVCLQFCKENCQSDINSIMLAMNLQLVTCCLPATSNLSVLHRAQHARQVAGFRLRCTHQKLLRFALCDQHKVATAQRIINPADPQLSIALHTELPPAAKHKSQNMKASPAGNSRYVIASPSCSSSVYGTSCSSSRGKTVWYT